VTTEQLEEMLKAITQVTNEEKVKKICSVMDDDHDGNISLDQLTKVECNCHGDVLFIDQIRWWNELE